MTVQTDLRAGGGNHGKRKGHCECGWTFYVLNDWEVHAFQNFIIGNNNDHNEFEYEN